MRIEFMNMTLQTQERAIPASALFSTPVQNGLRQRKCPGCGTFSQGDEHQDEQEKRLSLQRRSTDGTGQDVIPPVVHEVLNSPGQPLDSGTRAFMEPRFGHDFSKVRVHTDARASDSAKAVNALAYTVGNNMVFGSGQYAPGATEGQKLIVHELTHVMQQKRNAFLSGLSLDTEGSAAENEARHLSKKIAGTNSPISRVTPAPSGKIQRQLSQGEPTQSGGGSATGPVIYMCSKDLDTSPVGKHAFFRVGGTGKGNPTYSLQPIDTLKADCWQGVPDKNYPSDFNADAKCEPTAISMSCLEREFKAYPIGHYCTLGPNSNTFVGHVARQCGISKPDPPGWTPGIDDSPPPSGTYAPDKWKTLKGCKTKTCTPPGQ
jgi:hypothetical protein